MAKRKVAPSSQAAESESSFNPQSLNVFARHNRGLLLDLVVFVLNLVLMRRLTSMFIDLFKLADRGIELARLLLMATSVAMWVLPAAGAVFKRWGHNKRRTAGVEDSTLSGCLFNPIIYFCLNLVVISAVVAGVGTELLGSKQMDNGAIFIPTILAGLILTIIQTYLIYQYFTPPKKPPRWKFLMTPASDTLGDICLFLNMILFQVGWNLLTFSPLGRVSGVAEFLGRLFFLSFVALLIYFPPRMFYLAEDIYRRRTWLTMLLANLPVIVRVLIGTNSDRPGW